MRVLGHNVQFGECFTLDEESKKEVLIVDFGSYMGKAVLKGVEKNILKLFPPDESTFSVLLTHFHQDHISGFWKTDLPDAIDIQDVYLPDILAMKRTKTQFNLLQLHVMSDLFSAITLQRRRRPQPDVTLYSLLKALTKCGTKITFLQRNSTFQFADHEFQVLWPDFDALGIDPRIEKPLASLLKQNGIIGKDDTISDRKENEKNPIYIRYVDEFIDQLVQAYEALATGEGEIDQQLLAHVDVAYENMISAYITGPNSPLASSKVHKEIKKRMASIKKQGNRISIVFQDQPQNEHAKVLMTGDITVPEMNNILGSTVDFMPAAKYTAIKAPHHGTPSHFVKELPACKYILISNGETKHTRWGKISYLYGGFYGSHKGCEIRCTNGRCELRDMAGTKDCPKCKAGVALDYIEVNPL